MTELHNPNMHGPGSTPPQACMPSWCRHRGPNAQHCACHCNQQKAAPLTSASQTRPAWCIPTGRQTRPPRLGTAPRPTTCRKPACRQSRPGWAAGRGHTVGEGRRGRGCGWVLNEQHHGVQAGERETNGDTFAVPRCMLGEGRGRGTTACSRSHRPNLPAKSRAQNASAPVPPSAPADARALSAAAAATHRWVGGRPWLCRAPSACQPVSG